MNVFISSASRKVALVQSFVDAVAQLPMKGKVYAADVNPLSAALYTKAEPVISPKSNDPNYAAWLLEFCKQNEIRLIIPTRDEELELFAQLSPRFKKEGILINISSPETVNTCNDKRKFYDYCNANGFPVPTVYSSQSTITFPCFIKGRFGKGARFAFKIEDAAQLNAFSSIAGETIISEFVDWREYTVDYFADFKGTPLAGNHLWDARSQIRQLLRRRSIWAADYRSLAIIPSSYFMSLSHRKSNLLKSIPGLGEGQHSALPQERIRRRICFNARPTKP